MLDPHTAEGKLCDDDGIVRRGSMHHGTDYKCTGSVHPAAGGHILCTNPIHYHVTTTPANQCLGVVVVGTGTAVPGVVLGSKTWPQKIVVRPAGTTC